MRFQVFQNMACLFGVLVGLLFIPSGAAAGLNEGELAYDSGDYELAYSIWLPLALSGNPTAQYNLATLYRFGQGIEISHQGVQKCVSKGLSVIQGNADTDLTHFPSNAFDVVILSRTLQATHKPKEVLSEMLRIGKKCIVICYCLCPSACGS